MKKKFVVWFVIAACVAVAWPGFGEEMPWHAEKGFRWAELNVPKNGKTGFTLLTPAQTGIAFTNVLIEIEGSSNRVLFNGSGVAVGDYDHDGLPDIYLCGLNTRNALYKNLGNWKFKDVTEEAGVACPGKYFRGAVFGDVNGDGFLDLLIATTGKGVLCYLNDGHGKFTDATTAAGTGTKFGSVTLALADIDGNGTLDLYVANNRTDDIRDRGQVDIQMVRGELSIPARLQDRLLIVNGKVLEYGEPDQLYLNDGQGHFTAVSWTGGTFLDESGNKLAQHPLDWGLTAMFRDINGDGFPDLYVCNDYWTPDRIWLNDGKGHFRANDKLAMRNSSASSMGVDFADLDRDGHMDFFVVDMLSREHKLRARQSFAQNPIVLPIGEIDNRPQFLRNTLFQNRGDGTYAEIANFANVPGSEWSWSPVFLDVDLDGYEDLLITAGHAKDVQDLDAGIAINARQRSYASFTNAAERHKAFINDKMLNGRLYPRLDTPIIAFRNTGHLQFEEVTASWGTEQLGIHHGIAMADFDGDGDLDFIVNNLGSAAGIYRNDTSAPRVAVRLKGLSPNTQGIGAKIKLLHGAVPMQSQEIISGGRYMSGSDAELVFAAGKASGGMTIEVAWHSGKSSTVRDVQPNRLYEIDESGAETQTAKPVTQNSPAPFFKDVSELLNHTHHEEAFDDFERQPLLPRKLSQSGPGLAWFDLDGDGREDLIIATGQGHHLSVFRNEEKGFKPVTVAPFTQPILRDQTAVVGINQAPGKPVVLAGSANYEDGLPIGPGARQYDLARKAMDDTLPAQVSSTGPLALADIDGDGDLDLFIGGRCVAARYPEPAASTLFRNHGGRWELDVENSKRLANVGLVSGAVWSDLDGDGFPELILACEWGPVRVFKNQRGTLREATVELGLDKLTGWWNGVTTGDLDGDGKLDIIASNWGLNTSYRATPEQPARLFYGDLAGQGIVDILETEYDPASKAVVPRRRLDVLIASLPFLAERFTSHKAFSEATLAQVLGAQKSRATELQATTLASMIFFNRGNRFAAVELPREAQLAPAFSVNVADFDGDGHEDIFLSQNFFANQPEIPRCDAGRGLWLRGDGTGKLAAVPGPESGIQVYGEQRGAALCDYDGDGRVDLAVTQNGAATKLFHNTRAKPGLRVRLAGPPENSAGLGASLRLMFGERAGALREIHAGSGYLSQDSAVSVLATPETPTQLWVRWPGGKITSSDIPAGAKEIVVGVDGKLQANPAR